jgi:hypothetical protein
MAEYIAKGDNRFHNLSSLYELSSEGVVAREPAYFDVCESYLQLRRSTAVLFYTSV